MSETTRTPTASGGDRSTSRWARIVLGWRRFRGRTPFALLLAAVACGLVIGVLVGRGTAPAPTVQAARGIQATLLPLALDADGIWTSGSEERPPVSEGVVQLRREDDTGVVLEHHDAWLRAYDAVLVQVAGVDLPPAARAVQRQFIASITLSRDAVEVLAHAATVEDPQARQDLLTEVGRLRQRSEQLAQSARASMLDLDGQRADVSPLGPPTTFQEGRP